MRTGVAVRLGGEACKGCGLTRALWPWGWRLRCGRTPGGEVAGPRPLEHDAQPDECDQRELVEKQMRDHGKTPSCACCNESILPGLSGCGISRKLQVQDPLPQLLYAQIIKTMQRRRLVRVSPRVVFGTLKAVQQVLSACDWQINTAFV